MKVIDLGRAGVISEDEFLPGAANYRSTVLVVELTRRNLEVLLAKLDDPDSMRTIERGGVEVTAVENEEHYTDREPGSMLVGGKVI